MDKRWISIALVALIVVLALALAGMWATPTASTRVEAPSRDPIADVREPPRRATPPSTVAGRPTPPRQRPGPTDDERARRDALRSAIVGARADAERSGSDQSRPRSRSGSSDDDGPHDRSAATDGLTDRTGTRAALGEHLNADFLPLADECIDDALARDPELAGMLEIEVETLADEDLGAVIEDVRSSDRNEVADATLLECIRESALSMILPAPPEGGRDAFAISLRVESNDADARTEG